MNTTRKPSSETPDTELANVLEPELGKLLDPSEGINEKAKGAPVYDERGNVRPRGTKGARPMTYDERREIARKLADDAGDKPAKRARRTARKAAAAKAK